MKKIKTKEAIDVIQALRTIAKFFDETEQVTAQHIVFADAAKAARMRTAIDLYNAFHDMGLADRARALGMQVVEEN